MKRIVSIYRKKRHLSSHFPNKKLNKYDNKKSRTSASSNRSVKKLKKYIKTINKNVYSVNTQLAQL